MGPVCPGRLMPTTGSRGVCRHDRELLYDTAPHTASRERRLPGPCPCGPCLPVAPLLAAWGALGTWPEAPAELFSFPGVGRSCHGVDRHESLAERPLQRRTFSCFIALIRTETSLPPGVCSSLRVPRVPEHSRLWDGHVCHPHPQRTRFMELRDGPRVLWQRHWDSRPRPWYCDVWVRATPLDPQRLHWVW